MLLWLVYQYVCNSTSLHHYMSLCMVDCPWHAWVSVVTGANAICLLLCTGVTGVSAIYLLLCTGVTVCKCSLLVTHVLVSHCVSAIYLLLCTGVKVCKCSLLVTMYWCEFSLFVTVYWCHTVWVQFTCYYVLVWQCVCVCVCVCVLLYLYDCVVCTISLCITITVNVYYITVTVSVSLRTISLWTTVTWLYHMSVFECMSSYHCVWVWLCTCIISMPGCACGKNKLPVYLYETMIWVWLCGKKKLSVYLYGCDWVVETNYLSTCMGVTVW